MKRYLGKAIFEGVEVADSDFEDLTMLREDENSDIKYAIWDFESDVAYLKQDTSNKIANLQNWRDYELAYLEADYKADVIDLSSQYGYPFPPEYYYSLAELYNQYLSDCEDIKEEYDEEAEWIIFNESDDEYDALEIHRDREIDYIHESTISQINAIISARYFLPVYMINNKPGACDVCISLNKTVATLPVLIAKRYIPPFHIHCRCFLTQAGYVVMSGTTPFVISELLSEAASEAGVKPTSLVPSLPPAIEPSSEQERKKWLAQIASWWAFWTSYYPIPATTGYLLHD